MVVLYALLHLRYRIRKVSKALFLENYFYFNNCVDKVINRKYYDDI